MTGVGIVIPMLNEAAGLPRLLRSLAALTTGRERTATLVGGAVPAQNIQHPRRYTELAADRFKDFLARLRVKELFPWAGDHELALFLAQRTLISDQPQDGIVKLA